MERTTRRRRRSTAGCALVLACSTLAGCWWTQPSAGPEQTRYVPLETELTADYVSTLAQTWSVPVPGIVAEPTTSGSLLYTTRNHQGAISVLALDIESGTTAWQRDLPTALGTDPLPVTLVGDEIWATHITRFPFANPLCADITRLDRTTGDVLGTTATELPTTGFVASGPIVAYIDSRRCNYPLDLDARLVVRDRETSAVLWTADVAGVEVTRAPIISSGQILAYTGNPTSTLVFDAAGCGASVCSPIATLSDAALMAADGRAFAVDNETYDAPPPDGWQSAGEVHVVDIDSGAQIWRDDYGEIAGDIDGYVRSIAVTDDALYVTGYIDGASGQPVGRLAAYPTAGCGEAVCLPSWTAPSDTEARETAVAADVVYTASGDAISAYPAAGCGAPSCAALTTVPIAAAGEHRLIVSAGHVFVVTQHPDDGTGHSTTITAYGLPSDRT